MTNFKPLIGILSALTIPLAAVGLASGQNLLPTDVVPPGPPKGPHSFSLTQEDAFDAHSGFRSLFNGKNLEGWDGDPAVWRVENGIIVGERRVEPTNNDYLVYRGLSAKNFDLKVEMRVIAGGSGIQYRSRTGQAWVDNVAGAPAPNLKWMMTGPQADLWAAAPPTDARLHGQPIGAVFNGQVYIENSPRRIVAWRGEVTEASNNGKAKQVGNVGDITSLAGFVSGGWNQYRIIARNGVLIHVLNGRVMSIHINDDGAAVDNQAGLIGIEAELNPARIEVKSAWIKIIS